MIAASDIEAVFAGPLGRIGNGTLRQQVIDCWVAGCAEGGWETLDALRAMPFTLLVDCCGLSFVEHTLAVTEGAWQLAQAQRASYREMPYVIDDDVLIAGGLLHDVGKLLEIEPDGEGGYRRSHHGRCTRHPISGAVLAGRFGVPLEIQNIIACHSKEGDGRPQTVETVLIHLADFATFDPLMLRKQGRLIEGRPAAGR